MKICSLSSRQKIWFCVFAAIAALSIASIALCAVLISAKEAKMYTLTAIVIVLLADIAAILTLLFKNSSQNEGYFTTKKITHLAIFTAISYIFYMFIKFSLPTIFPFFLDFQISDMPALLCGFMMGPVGGVIVIVLKVALKLPFSTTACVGELADLILGIAFVLPASLIYKYKRTKKGAILGLVCGSLFCVAASLLINRFLLVPFYLHLGFFGGELTRLVAALSSLYSGINEGNFYAYYLGLGVLPFNILRCILSAVVTFFVYKRCEKLFIKMFGSARKKAAKNDDQHCQNAENNV